mmetsp:Transcript_40058/g.83800  ORF Transcript_40058/g.83800 Transcript_40058/m.83800 type:complete len:272 (+) Transcript_40058:1153-1968(+)
MPKIAVWKDTTFAELKTNINSPLEVVNLLFFTLPGWSPAQNCDTPRRSLRKKSSRSRRNCTSRSRSTPSRWCTALGMFCGRKGGSLDSASAQVGATLMSRMLTWSLSWRRTPESRKSPGKSGVVTTSAWVTRCCDWASLILRATRRHSSSRSLFPERSSTILRENCTSLRISWMPRGSGSIRFHSCARSRIASRKPCILVECCASRNRWRTWKAYLATGLKTSNQVLGVQSSSASRKLGLKDGSLITPSDVRSRRHLSTSGSKVSQPWSVA